MVFRNELIKEPISLVFFSFFAFAFERVHANLKCKYHNYMFICWLQLNKRIKYKIRNIMRVYLFIILLKSRQIFSSLRKLSFLHSFSNIPMNKCTLCIHQIKLVIQSKREFKLWSNYFERSVHVVFKCYLRICYLAHASAMAVVLLNMQTHRGTLAKSPPGTTVGGW